MATTKTTAKKGGRKKGAAQKTSAQQKKEGGVGLKDLLRNPLLASMGAFSLAEEGFERLVKELIDRGEASEREGKKIVDDYRRRASRTRKDLEKSIDKRIANALKAFRLPTKKDLDDLERKINALGTKVDQIVAQRKAKSESSS